MENNPSNPPRADWYAPLREIQSLGSLDKGPGSLAGLHAARERHLSQFFTPDELALFCWRLGLMAMDRQRRASRASLLSVMDNSIGSARLLQFADPKEHALYGCDIHGDSVRRVMATVEAAGFTCDIEHASMADTTFKGMDLAIINPPFSIHLESPLLEAYDTNAHGRYGPGTSAVSHVYAVEQALDAAEWVVAIVPRSFAVRYLTPAGDPPPGLDRCMAVYQVPGSAFASEGAEVDVSVLFFAPMVSIPSPQAIKADLSQVPVEPDALVRVPVLGFRGGSRPKVSVKYLEASEPTITLPVTGNNQVTVGHDGRRIRLGFACGFAQARVMNELLSSRTYPLLKQRLPKMYPYSGSPRLDLEVHLLQPDPLASIEEGVLSVIRDMGCQPSINPGFWPYVRRQMKRLLRAKTPFSHVVWGDGAAAAPTITAKPRTNFITDRTVWGAPVIKAGEEVSFSAIPGEERFKLEYRGTTLVRTMEEIRKDFDVTTTSPVAPGWQQVYEGKRAAAPEMAKWVRQRMAREGILDWLTWGFQQDDICEMAMSPKGGILAWDPALGKTRGALALCLLGGRHNVIVTLDYLVPEFVEKLRNLPIPADDWQVINGLEDARRLRRINIVGTTRLSMPHPRMNVAMLLRRRVHTLVVDEGEFLANQTSQRSTAASRISPKKLVVTTATPIASYPRDVLPLMAATCGDGVAAQPWGLRGPYLDQKLIRTADTAERGIDAFSEAFVTLQWCTNAFKEDLRNGAKREVPKLSNLPEFRRALAPVIKRRVVGEPAVTQHVRIPTPAEHLSTVSFDDEHLAFYLAVADDFARWFLQQRKEEGHKRGSPLFQTLVRIGAVERALNVPQRAVKGFDRRYRGGLTSKQRAVMESVAIKASKGEKCIVYAHSPEMTKLLASHLDKSYGLETVRYDGTIPIAQRYADMQKRFRNGRACVLAATIGTAQAGMDIPEARHVFLYDRDWLSKVEIQAIRRALRPQTDHPVDVWRTHIEGALDEYQAQHCAFKADVFHAGLDWATPEYDNKDFVHMDTIFEAFVHDLAALRGMKSRDLREQLKELA